MPFVTGYFRRSAGSGSTAVALPRRLDVAIYGVDETNLLKDRNGARYALESLNFDSGLPGGFLSASFVLRTPATNQWPGRAGLRVIIRRGMKILWWGWIEDLQRTQRGRIEEISVTCLGPWQQVSQRLFSAAYATTLYGDAAIAQELRTYCNTISTDFSQMLATGVNIAPLTWSNKKISDLVKLVCDGGDSNGRQLLFAIWEPTYRAATGYPTSMLTNSSMEDGAGSPTGWTWATDIGSPVGTWTTAYYNSPSHGLLASRDTAAGTQYGRWRQNGISCAASTDYTLDYWVYFGAVTSISCYCQFSWYDSGGGYLTTTNSTVINSTGTAGGARHVETITSPVGAASFDISVRFGLPDSGTNAFAMVDDVYMYTPGAAPAIDTLPRARLWARNLSGTPDYYLYTQGLDSGLATEETTRELANAVLASYGSGSYTTYAQDTASQALYRRRDWLVDAGNVSSTLADAVRDAYLAGYKNPRREYNSWRLSSNATAALYRFGQRAWPEDLRAGHLVQIADGPSAGDVMLLTRVSYADGVVTATPERPDDTPVLLAKGV